METLFEVRGAQRRLSEDFALDEVNLALQPGEIVGLVGANGAGKTTIIRALLGLLHLDGGEVRLFGTPFGPNAPDEVQRRLCERLGVVLDTCPFPSVMSAKQVEACVSPAFSRWDSRRFAELLGEFGISAKTKVHELSRGMSMKLQLAVALSHGTDLLVLDEATAGLDPIARDGVLELLREFVADGQHGVLLSSHITSDFERTADRIVAIDAGRIVFNLSREQITDEAGVAHCTAQQAHEVMTVLAGAESGGAGDEAAPNGKGGNPFATFGISLPRAIRRAYCTDVLVPNRFAFAQAFPDVACDRASIEEYLQFALNGECRLN